MLAIGGKGSGQVTLATTTPLDGWQAEWVGFVDGLSIIGCLNYDFYDLGDFHECLL